MKTVLTLLLLLAFATPVAAQNAEDPSLFPGLKLPKKMDEALREMMKDLKPALDETLELMEGLGAVGDPRHYHLPEVLPNGDIILRRKDDAPPFEPEPDETPQDQQQDQKGVRT